MLLNCDNCNEIAPEPFCEQCSNDSVCIQKIDAECVIYHRDDTSPSKLTCMAIPNKTSVESILETIDGYICGLNTVQTPLTVVDSPSVDLTAWGILKHTLQADVNISTQSGNSLTILSDGLFSQTSAAQVPVTPVDTNSVNITASGAENHTIQADVIISPDTNNSLSIRSNGLFAASGDTADNGLTKTGDNIQLGGDLLKNTLISNTAYALNINNNVGIGYAAIDPTDAKQRLLVSQSTSPNNDPISCASQSTLAFNYDGTTGNNSLYAGAFGQFYIGTPQNATLLPATHYTGVSGSVLVQTDSAVTGGMLSGVSSIGVFLSLSVGTFGSLEKFAGFRARAPLQNTFTPTNKFGLISDVYGVFIEAMKSGDLGGRITRSWGLYQQDASDNNYFASTVKIGVTDTIDPSAQFSVNSTTKGSMPFPLMTQSQRTAIASPATGLHVYQTDGTEGVYVKKSSGWIFAY